MEVRSIELEIQRLLDSEKSVQEVVGRLIIRIASHETTDADRFAYWNFLFQAGYYQDTLTSMCQRLSAKNRIHWGLFVQILAMTGQAPSASIIESVFKGVKRQLAAEELWPLQIWDKLDPRFSEMRQVIADAKQKEASLRRENLVEKFHFLKSQRMRDQAARVIKRLIYLYPEDKNYKDLKSAFDEEHAREIISDRHSTVDPMLMEPRNVVSKSDKEVMKTWLEDAVAKCETDPRAAYDFALMFLFADNPDAAAKLVKHATHDAATDWLAAELFLKMRRFVDLLEHVQKLEMKYVDDPETSFAVAYLRAQALKALGQSAAAVEILQNIVQVRPNYRSAYHLILEWSAGVATG